MVLDRVGLTGATGMLGRHILQELRAAGAEVIPVSRIKSNGVAEWNLNEWLQHREFDDLFPKVQAVVHAGAITNSSFKSQPDKYLFHANVLSCFNLGQWALERNIPLVYISGAIVYANPFVLLQKESSHLGQNEIGGFYGFSKLLGEDVLKRLQEQGLKLSILRPTSIFGYGLNPTKIISKFLSTANTDGLIELNEPVDDRVDLIHATDVARATVLVLNKECWETFNISSLNPVSFSELASACVDVVGKGKIFVSGVKPTNCTPSVKFSLNIQNAENKLGWKPVIDLYRGLKMQLLHKCFLEDN